MRELRERLGWTQGEVAHHLTLIFGGKPLNQSLISAWESGKMERYAAAAVAFCHPVDPVGCLAWLVGKSTVFPKLKALDGLQVRAGPK